MKPVNKLGLLILATVALLAIAQLVHAEVLQCLPAHTPFRASDAGDPTSPYWFGVICTIGAILFIW